MEAAVGATRHVESGSVRVVTSWSHALDDAARRAQGQPVRGVIRQSITFRSY